MGIRERHSLNASWVILTMGDRSDQIKEAIDSINSKSVSSVMPNPKSGAWTSCPEIAVVLNGAGALSMPEGVVCIHTEENIGVPAGRNIGASRVTGDILFFLDDDAAVGSKGLQDSVLKRFGSEPDLAVVSFRIVDPLSGSTMRHHIPRVGKRSLMDSGDVTSFLGGACAIRAEAFHSVGGFPDFFFYGLEETDLAWRLIDAGWRVSYDADLIVHHAQSCKRGCRFSTQLAVRNRVLVARRRIPAVLALFYVAVWSAITVFRARRLGFLLKGIKEGLGICVERKPMQWSTVWKLAKLGRPPII